MCEIMERPWRRWNRETFKWFSIFSISCDIFTTDVIFGSDSNKRSLASNRSAPCLKCQKCIESLLTISRSYLCFFSFLFSFAKTSDLTLDWKLTEVQLNLVKVENRRKNRGFWRIYWFWWSLKKLRIQTKYWRPVLNYSERDEGLDEDLSVCLL